MSTQDDIREHMALAVEALNEAVSLRDKRDETAIHSNKLERDAQWADYQARVHINAAMRLKPPDTKLCADQVRASLADSYVENTA